MSGRRLAVVVAALVVAIASSLGCARSTSPAVAPPAVARLAEGAPLTVVEFFSSHCPCQRAHDERLIALIRELGPRGVRFVVVDAEAGATPEKDAAEANARGYPLSFLSDPKGELADALDATVATYVVVLDERGLVRYRGGIDSDRSHTTDDAQPWLRDALLALLAGRAPTQTETKSLGCVLQRD